MVVVVLLPWLSVLSWVQEGLIQEVAPAKNYIDDDTDDDDIGDAATLATLTLVAKSL